MSAAITFACASPLPSFHLAQDEFLQKAVEVYLKETEITATDPIGER